MSTANWEYILSKQTELALLSSQLQESDCNLEHQHSLLLGNQQNLNLIYQDILEVEAYHKSTNPQTMSQNADLAMDFAYLVPEYGFFLQGWLVTIELKLKNLIFQDAQGFALDIKDSLVRFKRADVYDLYVKNGISLASNNLGFYGLVRCDTARLTPPFSLTLQLENNEIKSLSVQLNQVENEDLKTIKNVLMLMGNQGFQVEQQLKNHLGPTVYSIWKQSYNKKMDCQILAYENQPNNPEVSLVVPLYGRIDFVQYQLSLFADDPDLQKTQLIYILDDPRLENELFELSSQLSPLFKVPFQVIYTGQNLGYARANNLAVKHAQGKYIILLNSDVMPCEIGWITTLKNFYEVEENIGALGPTLIYEDNSIQHRGITPFRVPPYQYLWFNDHPGKGQPNFQCLVTPYLVPAVTGACLLVSRRLYLECGGLCDDYILGDFEDSDFCLKLLEKGLNNYCYPQVELYHLERQSQSLVGDPGWRQSLTLYNSWLYTQKWDSLLQEIVSGTRGDFSYE
jgi:GT2 family glycosyltransferase